MSSSATSPFISRIPAAARLIYVSTEASLPDNLLPNSLPTWIARHYAGEGGGDRGRLPLPERAAVRAWLAQEGIDSQTDVVVYDAGNGSSAARAWWVLNWAGHHRVAILDGGLKSGNPEAAAAEPTVFTSHGSFQSITSEEIGQNPQGFLLVDARGTSAFDGDGSAPAHLPGAINIPMALLQDAEGKLLPYSQRKGLVDEFNLKQRDRPLVIYCGSGNAAAWLAAALQDLDIDPTLYVGSWSAWSARQA
ncbi:hypothetical protein BTJ39_12345 [Izhakiella australiensis]|uniref:Rhodanese domain-containing protein n=1 Tax=Izhakiella australiensis TaxID=1926881 RepID=A0A1S8YM35_9GAMM|nr:rhodanese-like domain-containing protein [Izhakiella australiensis]OON39816.1 hypothetical protein BTJ39_12345 [Izhakiella australiensis]